jgi:hypothetical protein
MPSGNNVTITTRNLCDFNFDANSAYRLPELSDKRIETGEGTKQSKPARISLASCTNFIDTLKKEKPLRAQRDAVEKSDAKARARVGGREIVWRDW